MGIGIEVTIKFQFLSPFHSTGEHIQLWADKSLILEWTDGKNPIISATTIKGWLRDGVERALRGLGIPVCNSSTPSTICGTCPVCKLFGHPQKKSSLRFHDAKLKNCIRDVRMGVSLSRYRKTSYEERLFSMETGWQNEWECKVNGFFSSKNEALLAVAFIWLGANIGFAMGGARSRGLGWVELKDFQVKVDGKIVSKEEFYKESTIKK